MAAFDDVGAHCSLRSCGQQDFLPISCEYCKKPFCKDHFRPEAHDCEKYLPDSQTYCPPCPSAAAERAPLRCATPGCKETLASHNRVRCQRCHQETCLKHRYEADHPCQRIDDLVKAALIRAAEEVPAAERNQVQETLQKVFGNILTNPGNEKFRSLKKANTLVKDRLKHSSCVALLRLCGFEDRGEAYVCPVTADLTAMRKTVSALQLTTYVPPPQVTESSSSGVRIVNGVIQRSAPPAQPAVIAQGKAKPSSAGVATAAAAAAATDKSEVRAPGGYPAKKAAPKSVPGFERRGLSGQQVHKEQEEALRKAREERKERYKLEGEDSGAPFPKAQSKAPGSGSDSNSSSDCTVQ